MYITTKGLGEGVWSGKVKCVALQETSMVTSVPKQHENIYPNNMAQTQWDDKPTQKSEIFFLVISIIQYYLLIY
jgi:hypothetical protein